MRRHAAAFDSLLLAAYRGPYVTLEQRIAARVQAWRDIGQHEHSEALRRSMWELLGQYIKGHK